MTSYISGIAPGLPKVGLAGCRRAMTSSAAPPPTVARADTGNSAHLNGNVQVPHDNFPEHLEGTVAMLFYW
jgi:hypothetical protein